ncbi:hypothetical protein E1B28_005437 [Marasmius oreades]|uniref:Uncharacterized protein n=1 Tax=Marasmius oreades TaxID=181124 RepID=A0A9P7S3P8_9AGAR|nr:uncharacterized protein E1B28_005437 [Marasmius oreades]KAG7094613.1 hypothetical protein E1B28_005437 [Marasmius oreades]
MSSSSDHTWKAASPQAVEQWLKTSKAVAIHLQLMFQMEWPEEFSQFEHMHKAARWIHREIDQGLWIGKVIVYKLGSSVHLDGNNVCPTATYCLGAFNGRHMEILDLEACLLYKPGDVIIGWMNVLFHRVSPWDISEPFPDEVSKFLEEYKVTSGHVSVVSFFPESAYTALKDKPEGWARTTSFGRRKIHC